MTGEELDPPRLSDVSMRNPIKALNELLRQELGETPNGQNKFKWERTDKLHYFVDNGMREKRTESGLIVFESTYDRFQWAGIYGKRWVMVMWRGFTREEWIRTYGTTIPFPAQGEYQLFGSSMLARLDMPPEEGESRHPDVDLTRYAIRRIREHLAKNDAQHAADIAAPHEKAQREKTQLFEDLVGEEMFPFDQVPGTKGAASLPTPKFLQT